jgi:hypothetical protein
MPGSPLVEAKIEMRIGLRQSAIAGPQDRDSRQVDSFIAISPIKEVLRQFTAVDLIHLDAKDRPTSCTHPM